MYYPDLTPYSYSRDVGLTNPEGDTHFNKTHTLLNIGWLDDVHEFSLGYVSEQFLEELFYFCTNPVNQTRGFHVCQFCACPPSTPMKLKRNGLEITVDIPRIMFAERAGQKAWLGSAEIRVLGVEGKIYAAPTMIYHYVADHSYLPPDEFIRAVLANKRTTN